jgi:hypothetical protein
VAAQAGQPETGPACFTKADASSNYFFLEQCLMSVFMDFRRLHFVLSGFTLRLAAHLSRSFSNHSYCYDFSNDQTNCFASHTVNSGSLVKQAG